MVGREEGCSSNTSQFPYYPIEMDENNEIPYEINSFHVNKVPHTSIVDLRKKRKLQDEQLGSPILKHKFRDRSSGSEHEPPFAEDSEAKEVFYTGIINGKVEGRPPEYTSELESVEDSNSGIGESDSAISPDAEAKYEPVFPKVCTYDQPSTSSGTCGNNSFKNTIFSLDSISIEKRSVGEEESLPNPPNHKLTLQFEAGSPSPEGQLPGFGKYPDYIFSEYTTDEIEQSLEVGSEEMMLYSNEVTSNSYALSPSRWNINQDDRLGTRKPTIDQEFEQYFSMIMM